MLTLLFETNQSIGAYWHLSDLLVFSFSHATFWNLNPLDILQFPKIYSTHIYSNSLF